VPRSNAGTLKFTINFILLRFSKYFSSISKLNSLSKIKGHEFLTERRISDLKSRKVKLPLTAFSFDVIINAFSFQNQDATLKAIEGKPTNSGFVSKFTPFKI